MVKAGAGEWKLRPKERAGWALTGILYTYELDAERSSYAGSEGEGMRPN